MHALFMGSMATFSHSYVQADFFGKLIFLSLFALSLISWFFMLHKLWALKTITSYAKKLKKQARDNQEAILQLKQDKLPHFFKQTLSHPFQSLYLTLKEKTIEILDKNYFFSKEKHLDHSKHSHYLSSADIELIDAHLQATIAREKESLEKNLFVLSTTVTLAPFLGLLGTVWGILVTFSELQKGASISSSQAILGGLSTALATTVLGLLIAIPALIAYNYLKNASRHFSTEMEDFSHFLLSTIELQYRKVDIHIS